MKKRGPKPRPKLTPFEAALVRYGLPANGGIAALSGAWECSRSVTMRVLGGTLPAPEAAFSSSPGSLGSPTPFAPSALIPNDMQGLALMLPTLVAPRQPSVPPARVHVGFDRLVIDTSVRLGVDPDAIVPRNYVKVSFPIVTHATMRQWTMQRLASDRDAGEDRKVFWRRNVSVYDEDGVALGTLRYERAFRSLPELRVDLSGAAWRRGHATTLGAALLGALADPEATRIADAHVAIDLDADLDDFVPFVLDGRAWPRLPEMRSFLVHNSGVASGYEWSRRDAIVILAYDKIAQTASARMHANDRLARATREERKKLRYKARAASRAELPVHAREWENVMRVEVRFAPGRARRPRDAGSVLDSIRTCFATMGLADLRLLEGFDTNAWLLGQARAYGLRSQPPDVATMEAAHEPRRPRHGDDETEQDSLVWPDLGSRMLKKLLASANTETALAGARVLHAHVLDRLRALDARTPLRLVEEFDRAEPALRATLAAMGVK